MTETNFDDWKTEVLKYLEHQGDVGLTVPAMLESLATNGWAVPSQMGLRVFLERKIESGELVRVWVSSDAGGGSYYRLASPGERNPRTFADLFADRSGVYLDEKGQSPCPIEVVVWDKRDNTVRYFRNWFGVATGADGEDLGEWHKPEWVEGSAEVFIVHAEEHVTPEETPTVSDFLQHCASWVIEPNGELVANVPKV